MHEILSLYSTTKCGIQEINDGYRLFAGCLLTHEIPQVLRVYPSPLLPIQQVKGVTQFIARDLLLLLLVNGLLVLLYEQDVLGVSDGASRVTFHLLNKFDDLILGYTGLYRGKQFYKLLSVQVYTPEVSSPNPFFEKRLKASLNFFICSYGSLDMVFQVRLGMILLGDRIGESKHLYIYLTIPFNLYRMAQNHKHDIVAKLIAKMGTFHERLTEKFTSMGLEIEEEDLEEVEPVLVVEQRIQQLVGRFVNRVDQVFEEHTALGDVLKQNQQFMSTFYQCMLGLTQAFIRYSKQLYSSPQPLESLRSFRMLYESFSNCSTLLNGYTALSEEFAETQKKYIEGQVALFSKIVFKEQRSHLTTEPHENQNSHELSFLKEQNAELKEVLRRYEEQLSKYTQRNDYVEDSPASRKTVRGEMELLKRIEELEAVIVQNNDEFAIEVQRYNRLLYEQKQQLNRLQAEAGEEVARLQFSIRQLQKQLQSYREQKFKDQLMIQNMARKLRSYEREKRGYGSPPPRINQTSGKSSALQIGLPKKQDSGVLYRRDIDF